MLTTILISYLPYAMITAFTPGPNNILALNTMTSYGWKRGKPMILGIASGFTCVMVICAAGCFGMAGVLPAFTSFMKYIGAAYLIWLAVHIILSRQDSTENEAKSSFWNGFLLQFMNVKIILYAVTIYTCYVLPFSRSVPSLAASAFLNTAVGILGTLTWAMAGNALQSGIGKHRELFNWAMGIILIWYGIKLVI